MAIPLRHVIRPDGTLDPYVVQKGLETLGLAAIDSGGRSLKIRVGTGTLTFTAAATSATSTVAHGLGSTPVVVLAQADAGIAFCFIQVNSKDATNVVYQGHDTGGVARTGTNTFYWLVIG